MTSGGPPPDALAGGSPAPIRKTGRSAAAAEPMAAIPAIPAVAEAPAPTTADTRPERAEPTRADNSADEAVRDQERVGSEISFRTRITIALVAAAVLPLASFGLVVVAAQKLSANPTETVPRVLLLTIVIAALLAVLVAFALASDLAAPLRAIAAAVDRVSTGDLTTPIVVTGDDELARLAESHNRLAAELERRNRELGRILAALVAASPRDGVDWLVGRAAEDARTAFGMVDSRIVLGDPATVEVEERVPGEALPVRAELRAGEDRLGVLVGHLPATRGWERADQDLLELFASEIGVAVRNAQLFERVGSQNARLLELDAAKDDFLRGVSHNLQTPLTSIRAYAERLGAERPDPLEQLRVADGHPDLAREQLEQVLVGALPATGRRQVADEHAEPVLAGAQLRPDGQCLTRDALLDLDRRGVAKDDPRIDHPERGAGVLGRPADEPVDAVAGRRGDQRGEDPAELPVAVLELSGEAVVALGETGQLIVSGDHDRRRQVAGRDPVDGRGDGAQRGRQVGGKREGDQDGQEGGDHDRQEQDARHGLGRVGGEFLRSDDDQAERGERQHRRRDERDRDPGPERDLAADPLLVADRLVCRIVRSKRALRAPDGCRQSWAREPPRPRGSQGWRPSAPLRPRTDQSSGSARAIRRPGHRGAGRRMS